MLDSATIVNALAPHTGVEIAQVLFGVVGAAVTGLWPIAARWANNRKSTWYWNPITKKFVLDRASRWLGRVFGRGVNDSNVGYSGELPPEAIDALRKRINKTYPLKL